MERPLLHKWHACLWLSERMVVWFKINTNGQGYTNKYQGKKKKNVAATNKPNIEVYPEKNKLRNLITKYQRGQGTKLVKSPSHAKA